MQRPYDNDWHLPEPQNNSHFWYCWICPVIQLRKQKDKEFKYFFLLSHNGKTWTDFKFVLVAKNPWSGKKHILKNMNMGSEFLGQFHNFIIN